jgi:hypothetical protein
MSAIIRELVDLGVTGDALVTVIERLERSGSVRSSGAARQARYRERQAEMASESVTRDVTSVTRDATKESSPTPPKENTTNQIPTARVAETKGRGSRMPAAFEPTAETIELARSRGLTDPEITDQLERFRDWANAATGQTGLKRDWQAAFRNWIKRAADDKQRRKPRDFTSNPIRDAFAEQRAFFGDDIESARYDSSGLSPIG